MVVNSRNRQGGDLSRNPRSPERELGFVKGQGSSREKRVIVYTIDKTENPRPPLGGKEKSSQVAQRSTPQGKSRVVIGPKREKCRKRESSVP